MQKTGGGKQEEENGEEVGMRAKGKVAPVTLPAVLPQWYSAAPSLPTPLVHCMADPTLSSLP